MKKRAFIESFSKTAGAASFLNDSKALDKAGLGMLMAAPAYHAYKAVKDKDKTEAALGASELGGLGLLYRAVNKAKH